MFQDLTVNEFNNVVKRAIGDTDGMSKESIITLLEYALVKALGKNTEQRRELRRLNLSTRHINALEAQNRELMNEVNVLVEMLDRDDSEDLGETSDTDPSQLSGDFNVLEQNTWTETHVAKRSSTRPPAIERDMRPVQDLAIDNGKNLAINDISDCYRGVGPVRESYEEWHMRTTYPNLVPRKVG